MEEINYPVVLNKKRNFSDLITATFDFVKSEFKPLLIALLKIAGPVMVLAGIFMGYFLMNIFSLSGDMESGIFDNGSGEIVSLIIQYFFTIFVAIFSSLMVSTVTYSYMYEYKIHGSNVESSVIWERTKKLLGRIMLIGLVNTFIVMIGLIFFIVPGIYLAIGLALIYPVAVFEDLTIWESVKRSIYLVRDYWWYTLGGVIVISLVYGVLSSTLSMPASFITMILTFLSVESEEGPGLIIKILQIFASILSTLSYTFYAIQCIWLVLYYYNQVEVKDEPTLLAKIEQLGN